MTNVERAMRAWCPTWAIATGSAAVVYGRWWGVVVIGVGAAGLPLEPRPRPPRFPMPTRSRTFRRARWRGYTP